MCTSTPQSDLWCVQVLGKNKLGCGPFALLAFLPASSGINDRRIRIIISLGRSLPPFWWKLQLCLTCGYRSLLLIATVITVSSNGFIIMLKSELVLLQMPEKRVSCLKGF